MYTNSAAFRFWTKVNRSGPWPLGHAYDKANTYWRRDGRRYCRACHLAQSAATYAKRKAKKTP